MDMLVGDSGFTDGPESYRFPREVGVTRAGYPLPLCGKPLTKIPVVAKQGGVSLKEYPEHFIPEREELAADEMRITTLGSLASPAVV